MNASSESKSQPDVERVTISMSRADKQWLSKRAKAEKKSLSALIVELCGSELDAKEIQIYSMATKIEEIGLGLESLAKQIKEIKENQRIPAATLVAQCYQRVEELQRRSGTSNSEKLEQETGEAIKAYLDLGDGLLKTYGEKHGNKDFV